MSYLFAAYTIVWILICGYLFRLAKQNRDLRQDVSRLQDRMDAREGQG
jgi:CcmD family protein